MFCSVVWCKKKKKKIYIDGFDEISHSDKFIIRGRSDSILAIHCKGQEEK